MTNLPPVNEIGSKKLHEKHKIALQETDSKFLQAKVQDQLFIDHLLMTDQIDVNQHKNAEDIAYLASRSGVFASGPAFGLVYQGTGKPKDPLTGPLMRFGGILRRVERRWGVTGINIVTAHIVLDQWTEDPLRIGLLGEILKR